MSKQLAISKIQSALAEGGQDAAASALMQSVTIADLPDVLAHLLFVMDEAQHLAALFHQSASDTCPMECTEAEDYETRF